MSTPTLTRAAELLDESAADLRDCHTLKGDWGDEHEAREAHDEMLAVAADLRAMIAAAPQPPATSMIEALKAAVEGECDGLAISDEQARAILAHVLRDLPPAPGQAAQPPDVAQTIAWARVHPDGSFAGDLLPDSQIEDARKRSGAWVPLTRGAPADVARLAPVAVVTRYGASVRLEWASAEAAHNAEPGPLFALAVNGASRD